MNKNVFWISLIVLTILIAGCTNSREVRQNAPVDAASAGTSSAAANPAKEEPKMVGLNEKVIVGNLEYTVKEVKWKKELFDTSFGKTVFATADGTYLIILLSIENVGDEPESLSDSLVKIIDDKKREFKADTTAGIYLDSDSELKGQQVKGILFDTLNPGLKKEGAMAFDVPEGIKGLIQVVNNPFYAKEVAYIKWE